MRQLEREYGWPTETAVEIAEPGKKPAVEEKIEERTGYSGQTASE
jgi:hypothetical protein